MRPRRLFFFPLSSSSSSFHQLFDFRCTRIEKNQSRSGLFLNWIFISSYAKQRSLKRNIHGPPSDLFCCLLVLLNLRARKHIEREEARCRVTWNVVNSVKYRVY